MGAAKRDLKYDLQGRFLTVRDFEVIVLNSKMYYIGSEAEYVEHLCEEEYCVEREDDVEVRMPVLD